jgi:hypothetical protein
MNNPHKFIVTFKVIEMQIQHHTFMNNLIGEKVSKLFKRSKVHTFMCNIQLLSEFYL